MTTWELIAERAKELPADKQQELLDFAEFLRTRALDKALRKSAGIGRTG